MPDLSLVLPVLDEEEIITQVVLDIGKVLNGLGITYEMILVENESTDSTWEVLRKLAKKYRFIKTVRTKRGYGSAIIKGITVATGEYICYMPSDGQIDLSLLPRLWREIIKKKWTVVKIKRINRESSLRFLRSKVFNILARSLYPISISDINGSPRILSQKNMSVLELVSPDSFIDTEFAVKAQILGWKILELPMRNLERLGGFSTVRLYTLIEFIRNLVRFRNDPSFKKWKVKNKKNCR